MLKERGELLFHKIVNGNAPNSLKEMLEHYNNENQSRQRRSQYYIPSYKTNAMANSFYVKTIKTWNKIPVPVRATPETINFKA